MTHFKARAWISESDYELVRAEIEAVDTLSFGLGLLARVHKGTVATYQRRKVNNEVWLPERVTWTASAKVLLLKSLRLRGVSEFSNYRKFTVDTSTSVRAPTGIDASRSPAELAENGLEHRQHPCGALRANHEVPQRLELLPTGAYARCRRPAAASSCAAAPRRIDRQR